MSSSDGRLYQDKYKKRQNYFEPKSQEEIEENWDYYCDNTFEYLYYSGPFPTSDEEGWEEARKKLLKNHRTHNVIKDAIDHYCDALVGSPFNFYLSLDKPEDQLTEAEKDQLKTDEEVIQQWWDWQKQVAVANYLGKPLMEAIAMMLITDYGYLRLYTPKRFASRPELYKRLLIHAPCYGSVSVAKDDDGFLYEASYRYEGGKEIYRLLDNGRTEIEREGEKVEVDYGGYLPIFEFSGQCLITDSMKRSQNAINRALTFKDNNVDCGGFRERIATNGQPPGNWVSDPSIPGGQRFEKDSKAFLKFGPNKVGWIQGINLGNPNNPTSYTNPNYQVIDPVDVGIFERSLQIDYTTFYNSVGLGHLLAAGDGRLSGVSRETIKGDFITRLEGYAEMIEGQLKSIFSLVNKLLLPESEYSSVIELNLAVGKPLPEERKQAVSEFQAGVKSRNSTMVAVGVSDPDAEAEKIALEEDDQLERIAKQQAIQEEVIQGMS